MRSRLVTLSPAQKKQLVELGYVIVPNVVPREKLRTALRKINASIGQGMNKDEMEQFSNRSFCPELMHDPALMGLFTDTPALSVAESALGAGKILEPSAFTQRRNPADRSRRVRAGEGKSWRLWEGLADFKKESK